MRTDLVTAVGANASTDFSWAKLLILAVVLTLGVPLFIRLRHTISTSRRERWAAEDRERAMGRHPEPSDPRELP